MRADNHPRDYVAQHDGLAEEMEEDGGRGADRHDHSQIAQESELGHFLRFAWFIVSAGY